MPRPHCGKTCCDSCMAGHFAVRSSSHWHTYGWEQTQAFHLAGEVAGMLCALLQSCRESMRDVADHEKFPCSASLPGTPSSSGKLFAHKQLITLGICQYHITCLVSRRITRRPVPPHPTSLHDGPKQRGYGHHPTEQRRRGGNSASRQGTRSNSRPRAGAAEPEAERGGDIAQQQIQGGVAAGHSHAAFQR